MTSPRSDSEAVSHAFSLLHEKVQRWIWKQGWEELHDIQERAIPIILEGTRDVIIAAATASGKTEAAFLPIVSRIATTSGGFRTLYVSPLKALINDQFRRLEELCEELDLPIIRWHGDVSASVKKRAREKPDGIVLITPESLEALFVRRGNEIRHMFAPLQYVVIDELHAFIGSERGIQLQSLLHRLEVALGRRVTRIGLSATLGDMSLTARFLRASDVRRVEILESQSSGQELKLQLRGYIVKKSSIQTVVVEDNKAAEDAENAEDFSTNREIACHLFQTLRGTHNLVFAESRQHVEEMADQLNQFSMRERVPNEFFPHHGNLSRELREEVEGRMRKSTLPTTAICTTTLELGIDIGEVENVAQVGVPWSVAGLRQRLGRSGRRAGKSAVMRMYVSETAFSEPMHPIDALRTDLFQCISMVRLLLQKWYEPPETGALHLSTLLHQTLALIAQYGGVSPAFAFRVLCKAGPFSNITSPIYKALLQRIGHPDVALIEQSPDGTLLLGARGEQLVEHYGFFAVFQTPEEYQLVHGDKALGCLPIATCLQPGILLIFAGKRWRVMEIDDRTKVISVAPAQGGRPPSFGGQPRSVHERVVQEMYTVYVETRAMPFLDQKATLLLEEGRQAFRRYHLNSRCLVSHERNTLIFPWVGRKKLNALMVVLIARGFKVMPIGIALEIEDASIRELVPVLREIAESPLPDAMELAYTIENKLSEKYDDSLGEDLLCMEYASSELDVHTLPSVAYKIVQGTVC